MRAAWLVKGTRVTTRSSRSNVAYWVLVGVLVVFGFLGLFTIGAPFLVTGITLALLGPFRGRPRVFWPVLVGVIGFFVGFGLVAPFYCTQSGSFTSGDVTETVNPTVCRSLVGITYSGIGSYSPPVVPGLLAGLWLGGLVAFIAWVVARARSDD